jgi:hypothetical protein
MMASTCHICGSVWTMELTCSATFQYGFAKVRRGPDTDMYAHPSFTRGHPESLTELRKSSSASRRRLSSKGSSDDSDSSSEGSIVRSVSPSPPRNHQIPMTTFHPLVQSNSVYMGQTWLTFNKQPLAPHAVQSKPFRPLPKKEGTGRLDLLALAIERTGCFAT